jgi:hypothetical protein
MKKFLLFLLSITFSYEVMSCTFSGARNINLAIDAKNNSSYFYNDLRLIWDRPEITAQNCMKTAQRDQYLMIAMGLENFILSDEFLTYSINDSISGAGEECSIKNSLYANEQTAEERRSRLVGKRNFINNCLVFNVTDFSKAGLAMKDEQVGCAVNRISNNSASFRGPFCFIKPHMDSSISITLEVDKSCRDLNLFREKNIKLQDVVGLLSFYVAGDDSGFSADLTNKKQSKMRVSTNAPSELLRTNDYNGDQKPTFPTTWSASEVYLGQPELNTMAGMYDELRFPLFVNNRCETKCVDGLCTSPCDYSQPVTAEFILYEYNKRGRKELLASWFDGGVAPSQWQGELKGVGFKFDKNILEIGRRYTLEVDLSDQELSYLSLKGRIKRQLRMNNNIGEINRGGISVGEIPTINTVGRISELPNISTITGIEFDGNGFESIKSMLNSMELMFTNSFWPPYFEAVCANGKCMKSDSHKSKLYMNFVLSGSIDKPEFTNVNFSRKSNLLPNINISNYDFPTVSCGNEDEDDDLIDIGDFDF